MLSVELIALLGEKGRGGDIARLQQAIENANYEGREDDDEWIIADAMRQNEEVGGSTLTEQELRRELTTGDDDE